MVQGSGAPDPYSLDVLLTTNAPIRLQPTRFSDAIFVFDERLRIRAMSETAEQMYGLSFAEIAGKWVGDVFTPRDDEISPLDVCSRVVAGEEVPTFETLRRRPDGAEFVVSVSAEPLLDAEGRVRGLITFSRDINSLVVAREHALAAEQRFRSVFEDNLFPMVLFDADTRMLLVNQAHADLFGHTREEMEGTTIFSVSLPGDKTRNDLVIAGLHRGETPQEGVKRAFVKKDGTVFWVVGTYSVLRLPGTNGPHDKGEFLAQFRDITEEERAQERLRFLAEHDPLTSLLNRRAFDQMLMSYTAELRRDRRRREGALLLIDLDHFKEQNDSFGHAVGDAILIAVADSLRSRVRDVDPVGRVGGDEFAILLPDASREAAERIAGELVALIARQAATVAGAADNPVTATIGVTGFDDRPGFDQVMQRADMAMYEAKAAGRDCWGTRWV